MEYPVQSPSSCLEDATCSGDKKVSKDLNVNIQDVTIATDDDAL